MTTLTACSGQGTTVGPMTSTPSPKTASIVNATFSSAKTASNGFKTQSLKKLDATPGATVTIVYNGVTVATGALDNNKHVTLALSGSVPTGAQVTLTETNKNITVILAKTTSGTIVNVTENTDGTETVNATNDVNGDGKITPEDNENEQISENEDENGKDTHKPSPSPSASPSTTSSPMSSASPSTSPSASPSASPSTLSTASPSPVATASAPVATPT